MSAAAPSRHTLLHAIRTNPPESVHVALGVPRATFAKWCREREVAVPQVENARTRRTGRMGGLKSKRPDRDTMALQVESLTREELMELHAVSAWTIWSWCKHYDLPMPKAKAPTPATEAAPASVPVQQPKLPRRETEPPRSVQIHPQYWLQPNHHLEVLR